MVMIGSDSHKRSHTVVAVDDVGRRLGEKTVRTNSEGHLELVRWSAQFNDVTFALEDCRHLTRRLEADLLAAGCRVVRVPTKLMAGARAAAREPGKSDPIDAEAVAVVALRICPSPSSTAPPVRSSCSQTIGATWSFSAPGSPRRSAGTCTSSTRTC
jgi:transposase